MSFGISAILGTVAAATGLTSMGIGLVNASKSANAAAKSERESKLLMAEAERKSEIKFFEGLNVPLDPFKAQQEANLVTTKTAIDALREGDQRALVGGIGRVNMANNQQSEQNRNAMSEALYANNKFKAEKAQLQNENLVDINVGQAQNASARRVDQMRQKNFAMQQAVSGMGTALKAGNQLVPLFGKNKLDRNVAKAYDNLSQEQLISFQQEGLNEYQIKEKLTDMFNRNVLQEGMSAEELTKQMAMLDGTNILPGSFNPDTKAGFNTEYKPNDAYGSLMNAFGNTSTN